MKRIIPYSDISGSVAEQAASVKHMFDKIARRYDLMNDLMTAGFHRRWKMATARTAIAGGAKSALDLACGTGDVTIALIKGGTGRVAAVDFSPEMLAVAERRLKRKGVDARVELLCADALNLPFPDASFDCAATAFSLRNVESIERLFREAHRVLKPGGRFASLELDHPPDSLFKSVFGFYFGKLVPVIGGIVTGDRKAYEYLPESIANVPDADKLAEMLREAGFASTSVLRFGGGTVAVVAGVRC